MILKLGKKAHFLQLFLRILPVTSECTFRFSSFLVGLNNSLANSCFNIISLITAPYIKLFRVAKVSHQGQEAKILAPEVFFIKNVINH